MEVKEETRGSESVGDLSVKKINRIGLRIQNPSSQQVDHVALWEREQPQRGVTPGDGGFDMAMGMGIRSPTRSSESEPESNKLKVVPVAERPKARVRGGGTTKPSNTQKQPEQHGRQPADRSPERTAVQAKVSRIEKKLNVVSVQYGVDIPKPAQTSYAVSQFKVRTNNPSLKRFQSPKQREMKTQIQWHQTPQNAERDPTDQMKDDIAQFLNLKLLHQEFQPQSRYEDDGGHQEPKVVTGTDVYQESLARSSNIERQGTMQQSSPQSVHPGQEFQETLLLGRKRSVSPILADSLTRHGSKPRPVERSPTSVKIPEPEEDGKKFEQPLSQVGNPDDDQPPKDDLTADKLEQNWESQLISAQKRAGERGKEDSRTRSMRHSSLSINRRTSLEGGQELRGLETVDVQTHEDALAQVAEQGRPQDVGSVGANNDSALNEVDLSHKGKTQKEATTARETRAQDQQAEGLAVVRQLLHVRNEGATLEDAETLDNGADNTTEVPIYRNTNNSQDYTVVAMLPAVVGQSRSNKHHQVNISIPGSAPENTLSSVGDGQTPRQGIAPVYKGAPRITTKDGLHRSGLLVEQKDRIGNRNRKGGKNFAAVTNVEIVPGHARLQQRQQSSKRQAMQSVKQNQFHFFIEPSVAVSNSPSLQPANATFISNDSLQVLENIKEFADGKVNPFNQAQHEMLSRQEDIRLMNKTSQSIINRALPFRLSQCNLKGSKFKNMKTLDDNSSTYLDGGFQDVHSNNNNSASPLRLNYQSQAELDQLRNPQSEALLQTVNQNQKNNNRYISSSVDFGDQKKEAIIVIPQVSHPQREQFQLKARGTKSSTLKVDNNDAPAGQQQVEVHTKRKRREPQNKSGMSMMANLGQNMESTFGAVDGDRHQHHMSTTSRFLPATTSVNETLTAYSKTSGFLPSIPASQYAGGNTSIYNTFNCTIYGPAGDTQGFMKQAQGPPHRNAGIKDHEIDEQLTKDYIALQEQQQQLLRQREKYLMNISQYRPAHIMAAKYRKSKDKHHNLKNPTQQSLGAYRVPMSTRAMQNQMQESSPLQGDGFKHAYLKKGSKRMAGVDANWKSTIMNNENGANLNLNIKEQNDGSRRSIFLASQFIAAPQEATSLQHSPHNETSKTNSRANSRESAEQPEVQTRPIDNPDEPIKTEPEKASSEKPVAPSVPGSPTSIVKQLQNKTQTQFARRQPPRVMSVSPTTNQPWSSNPNYFPNQIHPLEIDDSKLLMVQQMNLSQREVELKSPTGSHQGKPDASPMQQIQESQESSVHLVTKSASLADQEKGCQEDNSTPDESVNSGRGKRGREQILRKVPNNKKESGTALHLVDPFKNPASQQPNDIQPIEENDEKLMITNQISNSSKSLRYGYKMEYNVQFSQTMPKRHGHTQFMPQAKSAAYFRRTQHPREKAEERKRSSVYSQLSQAQIRANSDVALRSSGERSLTYTSRNSMDHSLEGNVIKKSIYAKKFKLNKREDAKSGTLSINQNNSRDPETLQVAPDGSLVPYASQTVMKKLRPAPPRQSAIKLNLKKPKPEQQAITLEAYQSQIEQGHRSHSGHAQPTRRSPTQLSSTRIQPNRATVDAKVFSSIKEGGREGTSSALSTTRQKEKSKKVSSGRQLPYILLTTKDKGALDDVGNLNFDQQVDEDTFDNSDELPLIASQNLDLAQLKALRQTNSSSVARKQMQKSRLAKQGPLASLKQPLTGSQNLRLNSQSGMTIRQVSPTIELNNHSNLSIGHPAIHKNSKRTHMHLQAASRNQQIQDAQLLSKSIAESLYSKGKKKVNFEAIIELEAIQNLSDERTVEQYTQKADGRQLQNRFKTLEPPPRKAGKPGLMPSLIVSGGGSKPRRAKRDPMLKASVSKRLVDNYRQISVKQAIKAQLQISQRLEQQAAKTAAFTSGLHSRRELSKLDADFEDVFLALGSNAKSKLPRIRRHKLNQSVNLADQGQKASIFDIEATLYC